MIQITCGDPYYAYDVFHIVKAFYPGETMEQRQTDTTGEPLVKVEMPGGSLFTIGEEALVGDLPADRKNQLDQALFRFLERHSRRALPWGILTGIRPTKIAMSDYERHGDETRTKAYLMDRYLVSEEKAALCVEIALREKKLLDQLDYQHGFSVYVGIPFCPSRCDYCSFASSTIAQWKDRVEEYLEALSREITAVSRMVEQKRVNTIYVGGGTPTTLTSDQMDRLLTLIKKRFPGDDLREITVEAGRPDSITREKLQVLKDHDIQRISVNPQTMQQKTLDCIGRKHSVQQVREAFRLAREMHFSNINMDLIAGLPGESVADFGDTLEQIKELSPDSLTVHSLAVKRASRLGQGEVFWEMPEEAVLSEMIEMAGKFAGQLGMNPYYLYRQKNMAGNFENTGYAKVDKAGIYNILIMEERQTILAFGAGASSKIVDLSGEKGQRVRRIENVKDIDAYIRRIDEMIARKGELLCR